ncbi:matrixin family metalloprotease [Nocardia asiatica]|uniref:matrixin family metalloprotease n=1 Tax=Nocardia asiatica TaxID=209252 RepID=UPI002459092C|nr:matrixin family metalloprotease [Nocardia asiatica]
MRHSNDQLTWSGGAAAHPLDVERIALHEIGHILGLQHSDVPGALMAAQAISSTLTNDDVEGIRKLYPPTGPILPNTAACAWSSTNTPETTVPTSSNTSTSPARMGYSHRVGRKGFYKIIPIFGTNKVRDIKDRSMANRAQVQQWDWWGGDNQ